MADNLHRQFDHIEDFEIERRQTTIIKTIKV